MGEEWVCKECGRQSVGDPGSQPCPDCGGTIIDIGKVDEDLQPNNPSAKYDEEEMDVPIESIESDDPLVGFGEELQEPASKKNIDPEE